MKQIRAYYSLVKPGIVYSNALTAAAGFFVASQGRFNWTLLFWILTGLSCVIASACVFNNYTDRDIDALMERTKNRALPSGTLDPTESLVFGFILLVLGIFVLEVYTNILALGIALLGFFVYTVIYGYFKRRSIYGMHIGCIAGATPPVVGYTAVTGRLDLTAFALFLMLVFWQMPHFFSIGIYRKDEYANAGIPLFSTKKGVHLTKIYMALYIIAFTATALVLVALGLMRYLFLSTILVLGFLWLLLSIRGFWTSNEKTWARQMFFCSLTVISLTCIAIPFS